MRKILIGIIPATLLAVVCVVMHAEPNAETRPHLLAGTWELQGAELVQRDGTVTVDPFYGPQAKGLLIVDPEGRYSLQIFRPDRPKFASGDKARGTPEEYKSAYLGMSTITGRISVDDSSHKLIFHIELADFPNREHTEQARTYQLSGNELSYKVSPRPDGTTPVSRWRRVSGRIERTPSN